MPKEADELLLSRIDIDVNAKDDDGWTALMYAALSSNAEVVELLLHDKRIDRKEAKKVAKWYGYNFERVYLARQRNKKIF